MAERMFTKKGKIKINVARLRKEGSIFEIDIDPEKAKDFKDGKDVDIREVLKVENVFFDVKKGLHASEVKLKSVFGTSDALAIAKIIIKDGELQLTSEQRSEEREIKKRQIINHIHANAIDPRTGLPIPVTRLENAFDEAKVKIDDRIPPLEQVKDIVHTLRPVLALKFEVKEIEIHISAEYATKCYSTVKSGAHLLSEKWNNDGSWTSIVECPSGLVTELFDKINKVTHGTMESKIIKVK